MVKGTEMEAHIKTCNRRMIVCELCGEEKEAYSMDRHTCFDCPEAVIKCRFCPETMIRKTLGTKGVTKYSESHPDDEDEYDGHYKTCPKMPLQCELGCDDSINRDMIEQHYADYARKHAKFVAQKFKRLEKDCECEHKTIHFNIPPERLRGSSALTIKSRAVQLECGLGNIYVRVDGGLQSSPVKISICVESPKWRPPRIFRLLIEAGCLDVEREGGAVGTPLYEICEKTPMVPLDDGSGDWGLGGTLKVGMHGPPIIDEEDEEDEDAGIEYSYSGEDTDLTRADLLRIARDSDDIEYTLTVSFSLKRCDQISVGCR